MALFLALCMTRHSQASQSANSAADGRPPPHVSSDIVNVRQSTAAVTMLGVEGGATWRSKREEKREQG